MTIRHVVTWKLASEDAAERLSQAQELVRQLHALDGVVPEIRAIRAGVNTLYPEANWDVTLIADFDSQADLEAYAAHPVHQEVVTYVKSIVAGRVAVDFEL